MDEPLGNELGLDTTLHTAMIDDDAPLEIRIGFPGPASGPGETTLDGEDRAADSRPVEERRRYIRVAKPVDFELRYLDRPLAASMIDISEGGMRCKVAPGEEFEPEKVLRGRVDLGDGALEVRGQVSWERLLDGSTEVGIAFVGLTERDAQKIRSHVFALQISQRRADNSHHGQRHRGAHPGRRR